MNCEFAREQRALQGAPANLLAHNHRSSSNCFLNPLTLSSSIGVVNIHCHAEADRRVSINRRLAVGVTWVETIPGCTKPTRFEPPLVLPWDRELCPHRTWESSQGSGHHPGVSRVVARPNGGATSVPLEMRPSTFGTRGRRVRHPSESGGFFSRGSRLLERHLRTPTTSSSNRDEQPPEGPSSWFESLRAGLDPNKQMFEYLRAQATGR